MNKIAQREITEFVEINIPNFHENRLNKLIKLRMKIEPLGYKAKEKNDRFLMEYSRVINKFSLEFMNMFCSADGTIQWETLVRFNSQMQTERKPKK